MFCLNFPSLLAVGAVNWYGYTGGDPANRFDPDGFDWISASAKAFDEVFTNPASAVWNATINGYSRFNCSSWTQIGQAVVTSDIENIKNTPLRNLRLTIDMLFGLGTAFGRTFSGAYNISSDQGKTDFLVGGLEVFGALGGALALERTILGRVPKSADLPQVHERMHPAKSERSKKDSETLLK